MAKIKPSVRRVRVGEKKVSVQEAYDQFLISRESRCSKASIEIYKEKRKPIEEGFDRYGVRDVSQITPSVIRQMISDYRGSHSDNGAWKFYTYIRTFLRWYWMENDLEHCPIDKVDAKRPSVKPKHGITREEIDKLLSAVKRTSKFPERDTMIIMLLADTGLRKKSILSLRMKDVDLRTNTVFVFEKDQNYHTKSFGQNTQKAIIKYLACIDDAKPDDPFIISLDSNSYNDDSLRHMLIRMCKQACIPNRQCHDFRRFYGLELYRATGDIYFVSRMLDHKDVEVTKRYLAIADIEDAAAMAKLSPMDSKTGQTGIKINRDYK